MNNSGQKTGRHLFRRWLIGLIWLPTVAAATVCAPCGGADAAAANTLSEGKPGIKILVAYQSKYGSTRQYAEWIHEDTKADRFDIPTGGPVALAAYDLIVIGGYIRAGQIVVAPFIRQNWDVLKTKRVLLFTTSGTPPEHPKIRDIYEKSLPGDIRKAIAYFPLPGRISTAGLTFFDQLLIAIGRLLEQDASLKAGMGRDFDGVRREHLGPILEYIHEIKIIPMNQWDRIQIRHHR